MPEMDGLELTKQIRKKYGKELIIVIASSYEHTNAAESSHKAGANMYLTKPLFQSSLFDLFMNLTGGKIGKKEDINKQFDFTGKRILLAEDNAMNRIITIGLLNKYGAECEVAEDGKIAVDKFVNSPKGHYDAILMDIQMPNMDGYEATRHIRDSYHSEAKTIPIIALSANAFAEDIAKSLSNGMNNHISKPIDVKVLIQALDNVFVK